MKIASGAGSLVCPVESAASTFVVGPRVADQPVLGMIGSMTTQKIAITVPESTLASARRAVKAGRAESLSAYVSRALEQQGMLDDLDSMLAELLSETGGPLTAAEKRWADSILAGRGRRPRRGRK
jgi:hypothetical protein